MSPSIDQQILDADVIVVASLESAAGAVQTLDGDPGVAPTYRPMQLLKFHAEEYLKGTGANEFTVEGLDTSYGFSIEGNLYKGYLAEEKALTAATEIVAQRNTTWDNWPGVLFLRGAL